MGNIGWFEQVLRNPVSRQAYEQEKLILSATGEILGVMQRKGITKADIARALEKTRANVGQILNGSRNMTLRSLAAVAFACGFRVSIALQPISVLPRAKLRPGTTESLDDHHQRTLPGAEAPRAVSFAACPSPC